MLFLIKSTKILNKLKNNMFYFLSFIVLFLILFLISEYLVINYSKSARIGYYFIYNFNHYKRNDLVLLCINEKRYINILIKLGIKLNANKICKFNMPMLLKKIIAIPNDKVEINKNGIFINGNLIDNSMIFSDVRNIKLFPQKIKTTLKEGQYIVLGNTINSFDSRYFGIITRQDIKYHAFFILGI